MIIMFSGGLGVRLIVNPTDTPSDLKGCLDLVERTAPRMGQFYNNVSIHENDQDPPVWAGKIHKIISLVKS